MSGPTAQPGQPDAERVTQAASRLGHREDDDGPFTVPLGLGGGMVDALSPRLEQLPPLVRQAVPASGADPLGAEPALAGHPGEDGPHRHGGEAEVAEQGDQPAGPDGAFPLQQIVAEEGEDEILGAETGDRLTCHAANARRKSDI